MAIKNSCNLNGVIFAENLREVSDKSYTTSAARRGEKSAYYQFGFAYGRKFDNTVFNGIMYAMTKRAAIIDRGDYSNYNYDRQRYSRYISKTELQNPNFKSAEDTNETRHYTYIKRYQYDTIDYEIPIDPNTGYRVSIDTGYLDDIYKRYSNFLRHVYTSQDCEKDKLANFKIYYPNYDLYDYSYNEDMTTYMAKLGMPEMRSSITGEPDDYKVLIESKLGKQLLEEQYNNLGALVNVFVEGLVFLNSKEVEEYFKNITGNIFTTNDTMINQCIANRTQHSIVDLAIAPSPRFIYDFKLTQYHTSEVLLPYIITITNNMSEKSLDFTFLSMMDTIQNNLNNKKINITIFPVVMLMYNISNDIPSGIYIPNHITLKEKQQYVQNSNLISNQVSNYMQPRYIKTPYSSDLKNMKKVKAFYTKSVRGMPKSLNNLKTSDINNMYYEFAQAYIKHLNDA